jgi:short subunit dehydrogenase-like uncharacterized protein
MIYGASGYTGSLIAREAKARGLSPVLAGRSADKVGALANDLGLEARVCGTRSADELAAQLRGISLVLHCAGPFSATSGPMVEACLRAGAHYLDITGEIAVLESVLARGEEAARADVVLCPGVGFDVIPTDCIAAALQQALPDATHLSLGFDTRGRTSPGTAKTAVEGLGLGGKVREAGAIIQVPMAYRVKRIDFGDGDKLAMTIPWGDVSTAYHTTGIANVDVYIPASARLIAGLRLANHLRWLLSRKAVQAFLKWRAGAIEGPSAEARAQAPMYVWGQVTNARGETKTARIKTENGYSVTVSGALAAVERLMDHRPRGGSYTPSRLFGADFITKLPGSGPLTIG